MKVRATSVVVEVPKSEQARYAKALDVRDPADVKASGKNELDRIGLDAGPLAQRFAIAPTDDDGRKLLDLQGADEIEQAAKLIGGADGDKLLDLL